MKSMIKILTRYVASAAGVALILLILNLTILILWTAHYSGGDSKYNRLPEIADGLKKQKSGYVISFAAKSAIRKQYQWAMLLDSGGRVIWSFNLPGEIPQSYSLSEVSGFSRWYLKGYPVSVWEHPNGLLVLGRTKGSTWKQAVEMPEKAIANFPVLLLGTLIVNCFAAILLALLFGTRLFRSLRPIAEGIDGMAEKRPVELSATGLLGDLAAKLNQTSQQLQRQEAALQKRDNARTTWIAGVSHDIRTPLSIVLGYANQLEESTALPQAEREKAHTIRVQSERIKTLVNDLNLASKLQYDMQPLNFSPIYPAALVRSVAADFLNNSIDDSYSFRLNIPDSAQSAILTGDEGLLRRALSNLIGNSMRHNPDGCALAITVEKLAQHCTITVSDNGAGYPAEVLKSLKSTDSPSELGNHGLGLTIVRQIAKAHGGKAYFSNLPEGGCMAVLKLPVS